MNNESFRQELANKIEDAVMSKTTGITVGQSYVIADIVIQAIKERMPEKKDIRKEWSKLDKATQAELIPEELEPEIADYNEAIGNVKKSLGL